VREYRAGCFSVAAAEPLLNKSGVMCTEKMKKTWGRRKMFITSQSDIAE
jgi:hypothetical protein